MKGNYKNKTIKNYLILFYNDFIVDKVVLSECSCYYTLDDF